jgi:hypothetical protein
LEVDYLELGLEHVSKTLGSSESFPIVIETSAHSAILRMRVFDIIRMEHVTKGE